MTKKEYEDENNFELHAKVFGTEQYDTYVEVKNGEVEEISCDCLDYYNTYGVCKHSLASVLEFNQNGFQDIKNPDIIQNHAAKLHFFLHMCKIFCNFARQMTKSGAIYRAWTYLRHRLTAWNTTGEGIHSPYLFAIVRFILRDENSYYCFADIERRREQLKACSDELEMLDFGSGGSKEGLRVSNRLPIRARPASLWDI